MIRYKTKILPESQILFENLLTATAEEKVHNIIKKTLLLDLLIWISKSKIFYQGILDYLRRLSAIIPFWRETKDRGHAYHRLISRKSANYQEAAHFSDNNFAPIPSDVAIKI